MASLTVGLQVMKEAIKMTGPNFSARRMAKEYTEKVLRKGFGRHEADY